MEKDFLVERDHISFMASQLHCEASKLEETGVGLLLSGHTHDGHVKVDIARCLRVAANYINGYSRVESPT